MGANPESGDGDGHDGAGGDAGAGNEHRPTGGDGAGNPGGSRPDADEFGPPGADASADVNTNAGADAATDGSTAPATNGDAPPGRVRSSDAPSASPGSNGSLPPEQSNGRDPAERQDTASNRGTATASETVPERAVSETAPATPVEDAPAPSLQGYLGTGESLRLVREGTLVGDYRGPATVGVTDDRLLAVTADGEFVSVGLDRVTAVRSNPRTTVGVEGNDARLMFGVGYLLAVVGFLGVLGGAASALTPALTLVTLGGLVTADHVRRKGADVDVDPAAALIDGAAELDRLADVDAASSLERALDRLGAARERLGEYLDDEDQVRLAAGALAVLPFLGIVLVEGGVVVPVFALLTVASIGLVVYTFRNEDDFDGIELDWRRQRTVTACLDDGRSVTVRTDVDADLDSHLAGDVVATTADRRSEVTRTS